MSLITTLDALVDELRALGVPVSASEKADAAAALGHADLTAREEVRSGLAVTLVKSAGHLSAFDRVFDVCFGQRVPDRATGGVGLGEPDDATIRRLLAESIEAGENGSLMQRHLAGLLVDRHAGIQPGRAVAGTSYLFRAMRALDVDRVTAESLVAKAHEVCPYSNATRGNIVVDLTVL